MVDVNHNLCLGLLLSGKPPVTFSTSVPFITPVLSVGSRGDRLPRDATDLAFHKPTQLFFFGDSCDFQSRARAYLKLLQVDLRARWFPCHLYRANCLGGLPMQNRTQRRRENVDSDSAK